MSQLHRIAIPLLFGLVYFSGCCHVGHHQSKLGGHLGPSCGVESYYCDGCTDGGCDGCGDGPVIPCKPGATPRSCLGLGLHCVGSLLGFDSCGGCGGCGETYYHEWINDPPCCDPCDSCGNWTSAAGPGGCGSCGVGGCGGPVDCGAGCADPGCGTIPASGHHGCVCGGQGCNLCMGAQMGRSVFEIPGRALYATWAGVGGIFRELHRGLTPTYQTCNAFSYANRCNRGGGVCGDGCHGGYVATASSSCCSTCQGTPTQVASVPTPSVIHRPGRIPHEIVQSPSMRVVHGRPPHKVVADRLRR